MTLLTERGRLTTREHCTIIIEEVAREFGVTVDDIRSMDRRRRFAMPRHIAMAMCDQITAAPQKRIADAFGRTDHTCITYARRRAELWQARIGIARKADAAFAAAKARIEAAQS